MTTTVEQSTTTIAGRPVHVDAEGFLTESSEWDDELGRALARLIGIELTGQHWKAIRFARADFEEKGEAPTIRRLAVAGGVPTRELFVLFPQKPAKKLAYVAGLPKPRGCV